MLPRLVCYHSTVVVPKPDKVGGIAFDNIIGSIVWFSDGAKHHILVIAQKHFDIRHRHDFFEDLNAVGMAVNYIAEDVQCIFWLKVDLTQDGMESSHIAVDVRQNVCQRWKPPLGLSFECRAKVPLSSAVNSHGQIRGAQGLYQSLSSICTV